VHYEVTVGSVRDRFVHPAVVEGGVYRIPQVPGCSCDMVDINS